MRSPPYVILTVIITMEMLVMTDYMAFCMQIYILDLPPPPPIQPQYRDYNRTAFYMFHAHFTQILNALIMWHHVFLAYLRLKTMRSVCVL